MTLEDNSMTTNDFTKYLEGVVGSVLINLSLSSYFQLCIGLLQVKTRLYSQLAQLKSEEYWSLLTNEVNLSSRKWERIANDL